MDKLYLGIEIGDEFCSVSYLDSAAKQILTLKDEQGEVRIPAMAALNADTLTWCCGSKAEDASGRENMIVLHHLETLFHSRQTLSLTTEHVWHADDIVMQFFRYILTLATEQTGVFDVESVAICMDNATVGEADRLKTIFEKLKIEKNRVHVINRSESLSFHLLSQEKEKWNNTCYMLDYNSNGLWIYESRVISGTRPVTVSVDREKIEDVPDYESVRSGGKAKEADEWFARLITSMLTGRIVSSVLLCGAGFAGDLSWAHSFVKAIVSQKSRKVYQAESVFCTGAAFGAYHIATNMENFRYNVVCEGRTEYSVTLLIDDDGVEEQVIMIPSGISCNEAKAVIELSLIEENALTLYIRKSGAAEKKKIIIDLDGFTDETRDRTRIRLSVACNESDLLMLKVEDLGFGEIFVCNDKVVQKKFRLSTLSEE